MNQSTAPANDAPCAPLPDSARSIVLVGLMGAGKSSVGKRRAARLGLPFVDADNEIEAAAGCSIEEIFARHGEAAFRDGERRVITRLLEGPRQVLATGGGAFMDPVTRAKIRQHGTSIWLKADLDVLVKRCSRRSNRPLLQQGDPRQVLERLMLERYPIYADADLTIDSGEQPHEQVVETIVGRLAGRTAELQGNAP
jgi:shikimate kinase